MDILKSGLQYLLYPFRRSWSHFFYPPIGASSKTQPDEKGRYIIRERGQDHRYLILVPGISTHRFDTHYTIQNNLFDIEDIIHIDQQIEVIPAPCYHNYHAFSLKAWAKAIQSRIDTIEAEDPKAQITTLGISMGGAAVALASRSKDPNQELYIIVNTFLSLSTFIWYEPWASLASFFAHFIPIAFTLFIIGIGTHINLLYLIGLSAFITLLSSMIISCSYISLANYFIPRQHQGYISLSSPSFMRRVPGLLQSLYRGIMYLLEIIVLCIYTPTHWIAHAFTYAQIWLLDAQQSLSKIPFGKNTIISQSMIDVIIPEKARLWEGLAGKRKDCSVIAVHDMDHESVPHEKIQEAIRRVQ